MRPVEKMFDEKLFEEGQACCAVKLPESARLGEVQTEPRHFFVLTANASDESIVGGHDWDVWIIRLFAARICTKASTRACVKFRCRCEGKEWVRAA